MVVHHLLDPDLGHLGLVDPSIVQARERLVVGLKDQTKRAPETHRELLGTVSMKLMAIARCPVHVSESGRAEERR
jgi:hypothetical protein